MTISFGARDTAPHRCGANGTIRAAKEQDDEADDDVNDKYGG